MSDTPTTLESKGVGWFRAMRGPEPLELIKSNPLAYILAAVIAHRGQFSVGFNRYGLALGEALLGDHRNYGMSAREYRTAKQQLQKWGFATFKATNKGTVAKLADTRLFAIFRLEADNQDATRPTSKRQASDNYQERKNEKNVQDDSFRAGIVLKVESHRPEGQREPDWHGLSLNQKLLKVLGNAEMGRCGDRWLKRASEQPSRLAEVIDAMRANLNEGAIIKNRGGYAEQLWKRSR